MWLLYCNDLMVVAARLRDMATNLRVVAARIRYSNKIRNRCNKPRIQQRPKELASHKTLMRLRIYLQHVRRRDPTTKNLSFYDEIPHDGACFRHIMYHFVTKIFGVVIICWEAELFMMTCIYVSQSLVTKCLALGAASRLSFVMLRSIFV